MYHAVVRMMLNAGVSTERRTSPEFGVLPCRPPEASETLEAWMDLAPAVRAISLGGLCQLAGTSRTLVRELGAERERVADSVAAHQLETRAIHE